jgi:hypothetical protein
VGTHGKTLVRLPPDPWHQPETVSSRLNHCDHRQAWLTQSLLRAGSGFGRVPALALGATTWGSFPGSWEEELGAALEGASVRPGLPEGPGWRLCGPVGGLASPGA